MSVPQAAVSSTVRGYVSPDEFDNGINAFYLNYRYNGTSSYARDNGLSDQENHSVNLLPGLNIGPWRIKTTLRGIKIVMIMIAMVNGILSIPMLNEILFH